LKKHIIAIIISLIVLGGVVFSEEPSESPIPINLIRTIQLPKGYHEGLYIEGDSIWVSNGYGKNIWVINMVSGDIIKEIISPASFTEAIASVPGGKYWVSDWEAKKLYLTVLKENEMIAEREISLAPYHPAGIVWTGLNLYVITWLRGFGTKYYLIKMDKSGNILEKILIKQIKEPSQLCWDGENLWISSWHNRRVHKFDVTTMEMQGYFRSKTDKTTGIAYDGKSYWLTGTYADLYQFEIAQ